MKENIEFDERIISDLIKGKKISEISGDPENINDLATIRRTLQLHQWSEEALQVLNKNRNRFRISFGKISIAASIAMILGIGSFFILDTNYFSDVVLSESVLRTDTEHPHNYNPQKEAYLSFLEGKANYFAKDYEAAVTSFENALETPNLRNQLFEAIEWHLCVAYLKNNQTKECQSLLKKILKNPNPKYEIREIDLLRLRFQVWLKI